MAIFATRYAEAFADVVTDFKLDPSSVQHELSDFLSTWDSSDELREVFGDPSVPATQKVAALDAMKGQLKLAPQVRNLLAVLIHNDRIAAVHEVVEAYNDELQRRQGIHLAEVTTARELSGLDKAKLMAHITELAHGKVNAKFKLDPAILGGVVVRIGSTVYDGSMLGRVERLKEELTK